MGMVRVGVNASPIHTDKRGADTRRARIAIPLFREDTRTVEAAGLPNDSPHQVSPLGGAHVLK